MWEFFIKDDGQVTFDDKALGLMKAEAYAKFSHNIEEEKVRRDEEEKRRAEELKRLHKEEESKRLEHQRILEEAENRWIKCEFCGKIAKDKEFAFYGGTDHINLGTCKECCKNNFDVNQKIDNEFTENMKRLHPNVCPECGGTLRKKSGPYGDFLGCCNYPRCRYSRKIRKYE